VVGSVKKMRWMAVFKMWVRDWEIVICRVGLIMYGGVEGYNLG
jgi:hypothetical protein